MSHVRQQIRQAIITLVTGLTTTGSNVFDTPVYLTEPAVLPALLCRSDSEDIEIDTMGHPRDMMRELTFSIQAQVQAVSGYQNTLDTICSEIEVALSADLTLGGLVQDMYLSNVLFEFDNGEQPVGMGTLTYMIMYRTKDTQPEVAT